MALKKFEFPDAGEAIADAKDDELRQQEIKVQSDLAVQIRMFLKDAPYIVREIQEAASPMDTHRFSAAVSDDLNKTVTELAQLFNAKTRQTVDRLDAAQRGVVVPNIVVYIILVSLLWLFVFFALAIFANSQIIHSDQLTGLISLTLLCWAATVAAIVYFTRKFKWY
ncbi:MAG: hypothetical protein J6L79_08725 [Muribaculaceae bacterium]|nr:hypothetical protein [Muribaculaceae bacterium]